MRFRSAALPLLLAAAPAVLAAQTARITGTTSLQFVETRPLVLDSVPVASTTGDGVLRETADGLWVSCVSDQAVCHYYRSTSMSSVLPVVQDLSISAWGLGRGIQAHVRLRGRTTVAGDAALWPQTGKQLDLLEAYLEMNRGNWRVRAGRQWTTAGLDFQTYDGASLRFQPLPALAIDAYGGRSLARALDESRSDPALAALEPFVPDAAAVLLGARLQARPLPAVALSATYQREIRTDNRGLYSERLAVSGLARVGRAELDGLLQADLATGTMNQARLQASLRPTSTLGVSVFARHYQPFLELWTIWGAFDPVGYNEAGASLDVSRPGSATSLDLSAAARRYPDTGAASSLAPMRGSGTHASAALTQGFAGVWSLEADGGVDIGFGASSADAALRLQRALPAGNRLALDLTAFQTAEELRVDQGVVLGAGLDGTLRLGPRQRVVGSLAAYRHTRAASAPEVDWSQVRGTLRYEWTLGPEPGLPAGGTW